MAIGRPFQKGTSGNPNGMPRGILRKIRDTYGADAVTILGVLRDLALGNQLPKAFTQSEVKTSDRIKAGEIVLDRLLGKAQQNIDIIDERQRAGIDLSTLTESQLEALAAIPEDEGEDGATSGDTVQ